MAGPAPRIVPFGEAAFLVVLGERISVALNRRTHALDVAVQSDLPRSDGWGIPVPAYASLLVPYDPDRLDPETARERLERVVAATARTPPGPDRGGRLVEIPVCYGGSDGPDLPEVADRLGLSVEAVVRAHAGRTYRVYLLGFVPGFGYLGTLPPRLVLPRRQTPRPAVPPGSVGIAGSQTAVYPVATPGGWHLIGRTDLALWNAAADPPAGLAPGDRVRFVPLDWMGPR